eukprot:scaffold1870_cov96-Isochrysis_galbana.AAC.4
MVRNPSSPVGAPAAAAPHHLSSHPTPPPVLSRCQVDAPGRVHLYAGPPAHPTGLRPSARPPHRIRSRARRHRACAPGGDAPRRRAVARPRPVPDLLCLSALRGRVAPRQLDRAVAARTTAGVAASENADPGQPQDHNQSISYDQLISPNQFVSVSVGREEVRDDGVARCSR